MVRAAAGPVELRCGGAAMLPADTEPAAGGQPRPGFDQGTQLGKRYSLAAAGLEVLCVKAGAGSLSAGDERLELVAPSGLPSSD